MHVEVGTVVDERYRICARLGGGASGTVYSAEQIDLQRMVAVKVLSGRDLQSPDGLARFQREAQALSRLAHRNISLFIGYGVWQRETPYIVMELLQGQTLQAELSHQGSLPWKRTLMLAEQCCQAMAYAHSQGIVHRDLTPANIFLLNEAGQDWVKLTDFGLAKILPGAGLDVQKLTDTGLWLGTPHYMSPEQVAGSAVTPQADIYSLGCVMYHCLFGRPPYNADTAFGIGYLHGHEKIPLPEKDEKIRGLPDRVIDILRRALNKDPQQRFASMEEFASAIQAVLNVTAGDSDVCVSYLPKISHRRGFPWLKIALSAGGICIIVSMHHQLVQGMTALLAWLPVPYAIDAEKALGSGLKSVGLIDDAMPAFDAGRSLCLGHREQIESLLDCDVSLCRLAQRAHSTDTPKLAESLLGDLAVYLAEGSKSYPLKESTLVAVVATLRSCNPPLNLENIQRLQICGSRLQGVGVSPELKLGLNRCAFSMLRGRRAGERVWTRSYFACAIELAASLLVVSKSPTSKAEACAILDGVFWTASPLAVYGLEGQADLQQLVTAAALYCACGRCDKAEKLIASLPAAPRVFCGALLACSVGESDQNWVKASLMAKKVIEELDTLPFQLGQSEPYLDRACRVILQIADVLALDHSHLQLAQELSDKIIARYAKAKTAEQVSILAEAVSIGATVRSPGTKIGRQMLQRSEELNDRALRLIVSSKVMTPELEITAAEQSQITCKLALDRAALDFDDRQFERAEEKLREFLKSEAAKRNPISRASAIAWLSWTMSREGKTKQSLLLRAQAFRCAQAIGNNIGRALVLCDIGVQSADRLSKSWGIEFRREGMAQLKKVLKPDDPRLTSRQAQIIRIDGAGSP